MADDAVWGEPVSPVCQPVDTLAAVDKAAVDKPAVDKPAVDKPAVDKPAEGLTNASRD